jgi:hypothetical protein
MPNTLGYLAIHRYTEAEAPDDPAKYGVIFGPSRSQLDDLSKPLPLNGTRALVKFLTEEVGLNYRIVNPELEKLKTRKSIYIQDVFMDEERIKALRLE